MGRVTQRASVPQQQPAPVCSRGELLACKAVLEAALDGMLAQLRQCEDEDRAQVLEAGLRAGMEIHTALLSLLE